MSCSRVLNLMVLLGFMVNYMLRVNFNIAIVDMVSNHKKNDSMEQAANFSTLPLNDTNVSAFGVISIILINRCRKYKLSVQLLMIL